VEARRRVHVDLKRGAQVGSYGEMFPKSRTPVSLNRHVETYRVGKPAPSGGFDPGQRSPPSEGLRYQVELLVKGQEVKRVPSFLNLPVLHPDNRHSFEVHSAASRRGPQAIARVSPCDFAVSRAEVAFSDEPSDDDVDIRKSRPEVPSKWLEASRTLNLASGQTVCDSCRGEEIIDC
jgi:hypothetical protein